MIRAPHIWTQLFSWVPWFRGPAFLEAHSLHATVGLPDPTVEALDARPSAGAFSGVIFFLNRPLNFFESPLFYVSEGVSSHLDLKFSNVEDKSLGNGGTPIQI